MPKFTVHHSTIYKYEGLVHDSANQIMLYPIKDDYQDVLEQQIKITGNPSVDVFMDYYGNEVGTFTASEAHSLLRIESVAIVNLKSKPLPDITIFLEEQWNNLKDLKWQLPYINFLKQEHFKSQNEIAYVIEPVADKKQTPLEVTKYLCDYVYKNFKYIKGITTVETTLEEIWKLKSGVCQDFAHMLLFMLRSIDIPARYVSGYICANKNGMRGEGATHAWVEAYLPNYGWLGVDPTNNCIVDDHHVRLAVGRNFVDCSPVKGTYKGAAKHVLEVKVAVSYENEPVPKLHDVDPVINSNDAPNNSYRKFVEMQQQQQQQ